MKKEPAGMSRWLFRFAPAFVSVQPLLRWNTDSPLPPKNISASAR